MPKKFYQDLLEGTNCRCFFSRFVWSICSISSEWLIALACFSKILCCTVAGFKGLLAELNLDKLIQSSPPIFVRFRVPSEGEEWSSFLEDDEFISRTTKHKYRNKSMMWLSTKVSAKRKADYLFVCVCRRLIQKKTRRKRRRRRETADEKRNDPQEGSSTRWWRPQSVSHQSHPSDIPTISKINTQEGHFQCVNDRIYRRVST